MRRGDDWPLLICIIVVALALGVYAGWLTRSLTTGNQQDIHRWVDEGYAVVCWEKQDALACLPEAEVHER